MNKLRLTLIIVLSLSLALCASPSRKLEKQNEKNPRYQYNMGLLFLNSKSSDPSTLDTAIQHFNKAISLNPRYHLAFNARGLAYSMKGDLQSATQSFQKCLEINPSFSEARNNLGNIYEAMGILSKAEEEYRKALTDEMYTSRELPLFNLARMYLNMEKHEEALSFIDRALSANRSMAMSHNLRGIILQKLERPEEAVLSFEEAVRIVPADMIFQFNLAEALFKAGNLNRAAEIFSRVEKEASDVSLKAKARDYLSRIKKTPSRPS